MEIKLIDDYVKQLQLLVAVGVAFLQLVPYSKKFNDIGLDKESYLWLKSEIKFNSKDFFPNLLKNAVSQIVEKDKQR